MKHLPILNVASAILLLSACQSEQLGLAEAPQTTEETVTITGYLPSENDTKTIRDANGKIFWLHAEEISLFYASGDNGGSKFTSTNVALTSKAQFTGTIGVITGGSDENDGVDQNWFWGLYPYDATASCDGTYVYTTMKSSQIAQTGSFGDDTFITLGRSQGLSMSFYNVCGGIGFSVTRSDIKRVVLKGNGGETLGGRIKIGMGDDGKPFIAEITDGFTEIELTAPDGGTFTAGEYYYIPTVPVSLPSGFTLEFYTANAKGVYSFNSSLTVARSAFKRKASADAGIEFQVQYVTFADPNFESYCLSNFDTDSDGRISVEEAAVVTTIDVNTDNIESLGGIEWFTGLIRLECCGTMAGNYPNYTFNGKLTSLDVSNSVNLTYLNCGANQLTTLDVSNNVNLTTLFCRYNKLTALDVRGNSKINDLQCSFNQLATLDISNNHNLTRLCCDYNQLTLLDVNNNSNLTDLDCSYNHLSTLDASYNTHLIGLSCSSNQLTALDINSCPNLSVLRCDSNQLTTLDISSKACLTTLICGNNQLSVLHVSENTNLKQFWCGNNHLTALDVSNNVNLTELHCFNNQLTSLDMNNNINLTSLWCDNNKLTLLDVSNNESLIRLECYNNQLSSLDISRNLNLTKLFCAPMNDSNGNNLLTTLYMQLGQTINGINSNRSTNNIPAETVIQYYSSEPVDDDDLP